MTRGNEDVGPVVVGFDGSDASMGALELAVREAAWRGVALHVLHALDVTPAVLHLAGNQTTSTHELAESDRVEVWKRAAPILDDAGLEVVKVNRDGKPASALSDYCDEIGASVLVVGPRGRGRVTEALLGSTAQGVVKSAKCNILMVKS
ncbi:MAG TPA: universal stress protein [Acidimicrobiia bacterium]|nr:universal stress protein [Acidimicrobiia bacterium]